MLNHLLQAASMEVAEMMRKVEVADAAGVTLTRNLTYHDA